MQAASSLSSTNSKLFTGVLDTSEHLTVIEPCGVSVTCISVIWIIVKIIILTKLHWAVGKQSTKGTRSDVNYAVKSLINLIDRHLLRITSFLKTMYWLFHCIFTLRSITETNPFCKPKAILSPVLLAAEHVMLEQKIKLSTVVSTSSWSIEYK